MYKDIYKEAQELKEELIKWRRELHQIPETDLDLPKTSAYVQERLKEMGIPYKLSVNGSCVTAVIGEGEKCILLRSDMDGLPMAEESGLPFASKNGCMHACGHDTHATTLLGAARLLKNHEKELKGKVKLVFQPGEETFNGAKAAVSEGLLEDPHVDAAFAMHSGSTFPVGVIAYGPNPMAAVYGFKITLTGVGGHGSTPELCIDPINTGVHIYLALQELVAREIPSKKEAALTLGQFTAGNTANVIPQTAVLQGTLRTFDKDVRDNMVLRIREVAEGVAKTYRTQMEFETVCDVPAVENDPAMSQEILDCIKEMAPELKLAPTYHVMGSEDFSFISEKVPACYFSFGAAVADKSLIRGHHNPHVIFNEDALPISTATYTCVAMNWLNRHCGD